MSGGIRFKGPLLETHVDAEQQIKDVDAYRLKVMCYTLSSWYHIIAIQFSHQDSVKHLKVILSPGVGSKIYFSKRNAHKLKYIGLNNMTYRVISF